MIKNWSLHLKQSPWKAPELLQIFLKGEKDGEVISFPVDVNDFNPETKSLRGQILGNPHPDYLKWLQANPPEKFGKTGTDPLREYALSFVGKDV